MRDERDADRHRVAIELDGRDYHRAMNARDRDRIQQLVLERLGWQVVRLWGHAWFEEHKREEKRIIELLGAETIDRSAGGLTPNQPLTRKPAEKLPPFRFAPYVRSGLRITPGERKKQNHRLYLEEKEVLLAWMEQIILDEAPIHQTQLIRPALCRRGESAAASDISRIKKVLHGRNHYWRQRGIYYLPNNYYMVKNRSVIPRDRSDCGRDDKKFETLSIRKFGRGSGRLCCMERGPRSLICQKQF